MGDAAFSDKVVRITVEDRTYETGSAYFIWVDSSYLYKVYGMVLLMSVADMKS
jgi:hypothetical protein